MENYTLNYYQTFRKDYNKGLQAVMDKYQQLYIGLAIKAFGSVQKEQTKIDFTNNSHRDCFIDYIVLEQGLQNQKAYQRYLKDFSQTEEAILLNKFLPAFTESYTSLFRMVDIDLEENVIYFDDLLNEGKEIAIVDTKITELMDKSPESQNILMFFRFVPFLKDFLDLIDDDEEQIQKGMTSTFTYFLSPNEESKVIKEAQKTQRLVKAILPEGKLLLQKCIKNMESS